MAAEPITLRHADDHTRTVRAFDHPTVMRYWSARGFERCDATEATVETADVDDLDYDSGETSEDEALAQE